MDKKALLEIRDGTGGKYYGIVGDVAPNMTYKDGTPMQVGDEVRSISKSSGRSYGTDFVVCTNGNYFIMGLGSIHDIKDGVTLSGSWEFELINKYHQVKVGQKVGSLEVTTPKPPKKMTKKEIEEMLGFEIQIEEDK